MKLYCGNHPQHYFVAGKCRRCGARSRRLLPRAIRRKAARTAAGQLKLQQDQYLAALDRFAEFCRDHRIPFKTGIVLAMEAFIRGLQSGALEKKREPPERERPARRNGARPSIPLATNAGSPHPDPAIGGGCIIPTPSGSGDQEKTWPRKITAR